MKDREFLRTIPLWQRTWQTLAAAAVAIGLATGCTSGTTPAAAPPHPSNTAAETQTQTSGHADAANGTPAHATNGSNAAVGNTAASGSSPPATSGAAGAVAADPPKSALVPVVVARNVDGDTLHVILPNGKEATVRMLLIDTPETVDPDKPVEPYGPQASAFAKQKLPVGKHVFLEEGVPGSQTDKYGRLLAYVYITPTDMYNEDVVRAGLARVAYVYEPNTQHLAALRRDEAYAKSQKLGIWSIPGYVTDDGYNLAAAGGASGHGTTGSTASSATAGGGSQQTGHSSGASGSSAGTAASSAGTLRIVASHLDVARGEEASVTIHTAPGAQAHIEVRYKSGPSHAKGLVDQTADASGRVTWTWTVGTSTTPGDWPVTITSNGQTVQTKVHVR
ncbi:thermonuclease family protein [Alicyclobacillus macrosporangiidus]|uniref:Micrococcal nuclease n=1 Tax=Alicyclobacillus macrosporangiidus TaxID=392015 RepID=A0A1I7L0G5_9BACL|nr:thermonuclease family protein [Alicyclobacillus macrosporangiidus]SFV03200.1 micrococcal nuclease [Alicyclobacillus macrosporangiidus]